MKQLSLEIIWISGLPLLSCNRVPLFFLDAGRQDGVASSPSPGAESPASRPPQLPLRRAHSDSAPLNPTRFQGKGGISERQVLTPQDLKDQMPCSPRDQRWKSHPKVQPNPPKCKLPMPMISETVHHTYIANELCVVWSEPGVWASCRVQRHYTAFVVQVANGASCLYPGR